MLLFLPWLQVVGDEDVPAEVGRLVLLQTVAVLPELPQPLPGQGARVFPLPEVLAPGFLHQTVELEVSIKTRGFTGGNIEKHEEEKLNRHCPSTAKHWEETQNTINCSACHKSNKHINNANTQPNSEPLGSVTK